MYCKSFCDLNTHLSRLSIWLVVCSKKASLGDNAGSLCCFLCCLDRFLFFLDPRRVGVGCVGCVGCVGGSSDAKELLVRVDVMDSVSKDECSDSSGMATRGVLSCGCWVSCMFIVGKK